MLIYHLVSRPDWEQAQEAGAYAGSTFGRTLEEEGFVHCAEAHQVDGVRAHYFSEVEELLLLEVDTDLLTSPWRIEPVAGTDQAFPHVYGPLDLDAVVGVRSL